jgi:hypothetical protein
MLSPNLELFYYTLATPVIHHLKSVIKRGKLDGEVSHRNRFYSNTMIIVGGEMVSARSTILG